MRGIRTPPLANGLTAKQEAYALLLFQGHSQRQAYIQAGYSPNSSPEALDVAACDLAADTKVALRLAELRAKVADGSIATVEERQRLLSKIARTKPQTPVSAGHVIAAAAEISKLRGDYPPEKHQVATQITFRVVYEEPELLPPGPGALALGRVPDVPPALAQAIPEASTGPESALLIPSGEPSIPGGPGPIEGVHVIESPLSRARETQ